MPIIAYIIYILCQDKLSAQWHGLFEVVTEGVVEQSVNEYVCAWVRA